MKRSSRLLLLLSTTALFNAPSLASQPGPDDKDFSDNKSSVPNSSGATTLQDDAQSSQKPAVGFSDVPPDLKDMTYNCIDPRTQHRIRPVNKEMNNALQGRRPLFYNSSSYWEDLKNKATGAQNGDNGKSASQEEKDNLSKVFEQDFINSGCISNFREAAKLIPAGMINKTYLEVREQYLKDLKQSIKRTYFIYTGGYQNLRAFPLFLHTNTALRLLDLHNNEIAYVPPRSLPPNLKYLSLIGNKLSGSLNLESPHLRLLYLIRNPDLKEVSIEKLPNLNTLYVDRGVKIVGDVSKIKVKYSEQLPTVNVIDPLE